MCKFFSVALILFTFAFKTEAATLTYSPTQDKSCSGLNCQEICDYEGQITGTVVLPVLGEKQLAGVMSVQTAYINGTNAIQFKFSLNGKLNTLGFPKISASVAINENSSFDTQIGRLLFHSYSSGGTVAGKKLKTVSGQSKFRWGTDDQVQLNYSKISKKSETSGELVANLDQPLMSPMFPLFYLSRFSLDSDSNNQNAYIYNPRELNQDIIPIRISKSDKSATIRMPLNVYGFESEQPSVIYLDRVTNKVISINVNLEKHDDDNYMLIQSVLKPVSCKLL